MRQTRVEERRRLLLAATLRLGQTVTQCRIRDISQFGALVECNCSIPVGSTVIIARGQISVVGEVKWSRDAQFGIKFFELIDVQGWLPEGSARFDVNIGDPIELEPMESSNSAKVDDFELSNTVLDERISEELYYLSRVIENAAELLVKNPFLRTRHSQIIQQLDMGQQMLAELAKIIVLDNTISNISNVATGPMRGRLLR